MQVDIKYKTVDVFIGFYVYHSILFMIVNLIYGCLFCYCIKYNWIMKKTRAVNKVKNLIGIFICVLLINSYSNSQLVKVNCIS